MQSSYNDGNWDARIAVAKQHGQWQHTLWLHHLVMEIAVLTAARTWGLPVKGNVLTFSYF